MKIVRFVEAFDDYLADDELSEEILAEDNLFDNPLLAGALLGQMFAAESAEEEYSERWGMLIDDLVFPLLEAPYLNPLPDDLYAPKVIGQPLPLSSVELLAPVQPSKIVCVGRNYAAHAAELGNEAPKEPLIFLKPPTVLAGPGDAVIHPSISERVDYEGELAVVIGRECRYLDEEDALDVIFGYTVANDVTARDLQKQDGQWTRGKGFDTFGPMGPWIDTMFNPAGRTIRTLVNDEVRQESNIDRMLFPISSILAYVTRFMTLLPGDVILTGTPEGVGPVQPGDMMTVEIEGLGTLSNPVVAELEDDEIFDVF